MNSPGTHAREAHGWGVDHPLSNWVWTPFRVMLIYYVLGFTALVVSDVVLVSLFADPLLQRLQTAKGGAEVLLTGGLIFVLTRASREQLRARNERLERQQDELAVIHRVLRHDLRNALTVITGRVDELQTQHPDRTVEEACEKVNEVVERIATYVEQASRIRRVTETDECTTVDLARRLPVIAEDAGELSGEVYVDCPESAPVVVNPMFEEAVRELVANAIEHTDADRPGVRVSVDPHAGSPGETVVDVSDDGPGIPEHVREVIVEQDLDQLRHIDGMGLWFAYWTVTEAGGTFRILADESGTTVRLTVRSGDSARSVDEEGFSLTASPPTGA